MVIICSPELESAASSKIGTQVFRDRVSSQHNIITHPTQPIIRNGK